MRQSTDTLPSHSLTVSLSYLIECWRGDQCKNQHALVDRETGEPLEEIQPRHFHSDEHYKMLQESFVNYDMYISFSYIQHPGKFYFYGYLTNPGANDKTQRAPQLAHAKLLSQMMKALKNKIYGNSDFLKNDKKTQREQDRHRREYLELTADISYTPEKLEYVALELDDGYLYRGWVKQVNEAKLYVIELVDFHNQFVEIEADRLHRLPEEFVPKAHPDYKYFGLEIRVGCFLRVHPVQLFSPIFGNGIKSSKLRK